MPERKTRWSPWKRTPKEMDELNTPTPRCYGSHLEDEDDAETRQEDTKVKSRV